MDTPEERDVSLPSEHAPRSQRGADLRLRRTLLSVPLAAGAVAAGGVPGFLLGFVAALLVLDHLLDRVIGFTGASRLEAEHRFLRLGRERRLAERKRRLRRRPRDGDELVYLAMDTGWAAAAQRHPRGVQPIAIESLVGTVDAHKASAFDRCFRPPSWSRGRWTLMCLAAQRGAQLPPISVYRVGNEHFVRDGHHRVSVARALGVAAIDAHVVELLPNSRAQRTAASAPGAPPARITPASGAGDS
jgi:hypothetical protein